MSLATSCPSCGTVFRVVQDQLKISEGWVRCGHCQEVFNALEGLFDLSRRDTTTPEPSPDLAVPATSNPNDPAWMETRPAMFSDGKVLRERQEALQNRSSSPAAPTPMPASKRVEKRVEISTRRAATWDPSVQEPERGMAPTQPDPGAWRTTSADTTLPVPPLAPEFLRGSSFEEPVPDSLFAEPDLDPAPSSDETAYPATTLEFRSEAFSAFAAARLRRDGRPDVDLPLEWPSAPAPLMPTPPPPPPLAAEPAPPPLAARPIPDDLEKTLDLSLGEAAEPVSVEPLPAPAEIVTPLTSSRTQTPEDTDPHHLPESTLDTVSLPEFVRRADSKARWERPLVRVMLGGAAIGLAVTLVLQIGQHWHDLIAARWPTTQSLLARACLQWHCQLAPPQQLDALVVDSTTLSRPPNADSYVLGVTLHNRVGYAIAAPHIELSLTDMAGAVVLRRVLTPTEFRQRDTLAAQSDASWSLEFTSTNQRIAGYTLAAFYP
jgi:predicted Zn finger-like uncharacterized protein